MARAVAPRLDRWRQDRVDYLKRVAQASLGRYTSAAPMVVRRPSSPLTRSVAEVSDVVGTVAQISVYPVKSLAGRTENSVQVGPAGLAGDRAYSVVDATTGERVTVKATPRMREVVATGDTERDTVTLTAVLGRPVRLAASDAGPQVDAAAVHLVSQRAIARAAGGDVPAGCSAEDPRANLLLDLPPGVDERSWVGLRLHVGEVVLDVVRTPKHCLGVYAEVAVPGLIAAGDRVRLAGPGD